MAAVSKVNWSPPSPHLKCSEGKGRVNTEPMAPSAAWHLRSANWARGMDQSTVTLQLLPRASLDASGTKSVVLSRRRRASVCWKWYTTWPEFTTQATPLPGDPEPGTFPRREQLAQGTCAGTAEAASSLGVPAIVRPWEKYLQLSKASIVAAGHQDIFQLPNTPALECTTSTVQPSLSHWRAPFDERNLSRTRNLIPNTLLLHPSRTSLLPQKNKEESGLRKNWTWLVKNFPKSVWGP